MNAKTVLPSVSESAFSCPHCGAFTTQHWYEITVKKKDKENPLPFFPDTKFRERISSEIPLDEGIREKLLVFADKMDSGFPFVETEDKGRYVYSDLRNLHLSECYNCGEFAVWVHQSMVYPAEREGDAPNEDMPNNIAADFEEARNILNRSPRGAAALLRLCIQKLCAFLGEKGKNIDDDIASLVSKGLNPLVQKSLDIVRVVGNEAVHPGSMDIRDDRATALQLLRIVNLIVEQMITFPKSINALYDGLPAGKLKAIEDRNQRAKESQ